MTSTTMGVIGANGSGKSTLLRLIGGVGRADEGSVEIHGRLGALLNLNAGFHPDLTGRENVMMAGVLGGLTRREVLGRFDEILAFAEIEQFIDNPVRTYSTGMQMRLAFSTAVHANPDILLIDEVLSVGDIAFQRKCLERIAAFKASGCSIVLVTHDADVVQSLCDDVVWLDGGRLVMEGPAQDVVRHYLDRMAPHDAAFAAAPTSVVEPLSR
jgi:lipopolysaccharide transport system ATP-binding protein